MEAINTQEARPKRPVFLLVLCILSFVSLGFKLFDVTIGYAVGPSSAKEMKEARISMDKEMDKLEEQGASDWKPTVEKFKTMTVVLNRKFYYVQALSLLVIVLGVIGVVYMLIGKKLGFHLYIIYSLISTCSYYFFVSPAIVPTFLVIISAVLSGLFIFMYSRNLKWMR